MEALGEEQPSQKVDAAEKATKKTAKASTITSDEVEKPMREWRSNDEESWRLRNQIIEKDEAAVTMVLSAAERSNGAVKFVRGMDVKISSYVEYMELMDQIRG